VLLKTTHCCSYFVLMVETLAMPLIWAGGSLRNAQCAMRVGQAAGYEDGPRLHRIV
jgi:hypothetical protein